MNIAFVNISNHKSVSRGAGYIAGAIIQAGYKIKYYDLIYLSINQVAKKIIKGNFDLLLISSMTIPFHNAIELIRILKKQKNIPVIVGGVHATLVGKDLLEENKEIDFLCVGEGESMIVDFLKNYKSGNFSQIKNLVYRNNDCIISNPLGKTEELSTLPNFPWNYFWKDCIFTDDGFINVFSSRGCPYICSYCSNTKYLDLYGKSYLRFRPVNDVIEEIKILRKKYSPKGFFFGDEMLLANKEHAKELLEAYSNQINLPYGCMIRVEHINDNSVALLKNTGCIYVGAGIECGNEEFRKNVLNRKMSNDQIEKAYSLLKSAGIKTSSFNMIGFPFENDDILTEETIQFNKKIKPDIVQFTIFYPFPGTELYKRCAEFDLIDQNKVSIQSDYYTDSVLKWINLKQRFIDINKMFPYSISDSNKSFLSKSFFRFNNALIYRLRKLYLLILQ